MNEITRIVDRAQPGDPKAAQELLPLVSGPINRAISHITPHGNVTSTASFQVLPPPLRIASASTSQVVVNWSSTSPEFLLESSEQVQGAVWSPWPAKPVIGKEGARVTIVTSPSTRFLRLCKVGP